MKTAKSWCNPITLLLCQILFIPVTTVTMFFFLLFVHLVNIIYTFPLCFKMLHFQISIKILWHKYHPPSQYIQVSNGSVFIFRLYVHLPLFLSETQQVSIFTLLIVMYQINIYLFFGCPYRNNTVSMTEYLLVSYSYH